MTKQQQSQAQLNLHANQLNNNEQNLSHANRDYKAATDNHSNQMNRNHREYKGK